MHLIMAPDQRGYLVSGLKCAYQTGVGKEYQGVNCPFLLSGGLMCLTQDVKEQLLLR